MYLQVPLVHTPSPSQSPSYFRGEGILHVPPKPSVPVLANGLSCLPPSLGTCSSSLLCLCLPFIYSSPPLTPINVYKPSPRHAFGCFLPACPPCFTEGVPPIAAPSPGCAAWLLESCFLSSPRDWTVTAEAICDLKSNVLLSGHLPGPLGSPLNPTWGSLISFLSAPNQALPWFLLGPFSSGVGRWAGSQAPAVFPAVTHPGLVILWFYFSLPP